MILEREHEPGLLLQIIWIDENLLGLEASLVWEGFSGLSTTYTSAEALHEFASNLETFPKDLDSQVEFDSGMEGGSSRVRLRCYVYNLAFHAAVQVHLTSSVPTDHRPEEVWRLDVELKTEPALLDRFATELTRMALRKEGMAFLRGVN